MRDPSRSMRLVELVCVLSTSERHPLKCTERTVSTIILSRSCKLQTHFPPADNRSTVVPGSHLPEMCRVGGMSREAFKFDLAAFWALGSQKMKLWEGFEQRK